MMNCHDVRQGLWPPEKPKLLGPEIEKAQEHVRSCSECSRYFAQDRAVLDACHQLRSVRAPLQVRIRVFEALARGRDGRSWRSGAPGERTPVLRRTLTAAAVVLLVGVSVLAGPRLGGAPESRLASAPGPEAAFVEDYLRRAVGEDYIDTSDREEIMRFLRRELGLESGLLDEGDLIPARAEICLLEGRRGAMIVYKKDGRSVTHYLVPRATRPHGPEVAEDHGELAVVTWSSGSVEEALVGELPPDQLLELARNGQSD